MNERIKELAKEANANELSYAYYRGEKRPENAVTLHSVDLEKFAELLLKECGEYLMRPEFIGRSDLDWSMVLNEHFGVEE